MATQLEKISTQKIIPYIPEYPLIGSLPAFRKDRLDLFVRIARTADITGFHFGPFASRWFNKPEHVHNILVEHAYDFDKGNVMHRAFMPISGNGLFISEGAFHRHQRKMMAPSFQPRHIVRYADTMAHYGEQIQQHWQDKTVIDVNQEMTNATMSIIGKILFDADIFTEADELGHAMSTILSYPSYVLAHLFTLPLTWPTVRNRRTQRAIQFLRGRIQRMVDERRASNEERNDFLSILLQARDEDGAAMTDEQLMAECLTLFGAGHETTAATLTWAWHLLCQHPDAYQKVQQEVDSVLQGRSPTYGDLAHLPYSLQVFKEALRIYPPAYTILRVALRDLEIDGCLVPKGSSVIISPYTMHRRPDYFPEPEKFDPERFTPEREKELPRYAYFPFGAGPRVCIGNHFAMMEGHLLLALFAQRITFKLVSGQDIKPDPANNLTIRPGRPVNVIVERR